MRSLQTVRGFPKVLQLPQNQNREFACPLQSARTLCRESCGLSYPLPGAANLPDQVCIQRAAEQPPLLALDKQLRRKSRQESAPKLKQSADGLAQSLCDHSFDLHNQSVHSHPSDLGDTTQSPPKYLRTKSEPSPSTNPESVHCRAGTHQGCRRALAIHMSDHHLVATSRAPHQHLG